MAVATSGASPVAEKAVAIEIVTCQNPFFWHTVNNNGLSNCRFESQNQTLGKYFMIYEAATRFFWYKLKAGEGEKIYRI